VKGCPHRAGTRRLCRVTVLSQTVPTKHSRMRPQRIGAGLLGTGKAGRIVLQVVFIAPRGRIYSTYRHIAPTAVIRSLYEVIQYIRSRTRPAIETAANSRLRARVARVGLALDFFVLWRFLPRFFLASVAPQFFALRFFDCLSSNVSFLSLAHLIPGLYEVIFIPSPSAPLQGQGHARGCVVSGLLNFRPCT